MHLVFDYLQCENVCGNKCIFLHFRILAEVNILCTSPEQGAQWVPLIDSLIPIYATNTQVNDVEKNSSSCKI